jgi:AraC family transcriptional regulator
MEPPRIVEFPGKEVSGVRLRMSHGGDRTSELWRGFRSRLAEASLQFVAAYSIRVYDESYSFSTFDRGAEFDKWAAVDSNLNPELSESLERLVVPPGRYAVFIHKGTAMDAPRTFRNIFGVWLPASNFEVDSRPHFEILPPGYDPFDPRTEEEVWLPIRERQEASTL